MATTGDIRIRLHRYPGRRYFYALAYFGGKLKKLDFLLPLLNVPARHYCEPFGGSAVVLMHREPASIETYNDASGAVANFFKVLRDRPADLVEKLKLTPFARQEWLEAHASIGQDPPADPVEWARQFFIMSHQTFGGMVWGGAGWIHSVTISKRHMAAHVNRWMTSVDDLEWSVLRMQRVQIEHRDALDIIRDYDTPDTLFYLDPPYPKVGEYENNLDQDYHTRLAEALHGIEGLAAISGYAGSYDALYAGWRREVDRVRKQSINQGRVDDEKKLERQEILWLNYGPDGVRLK